MSTVATVSLAANGSHGFPSRSRAYGDNETHPQTNAPPASKPASHRRKIMELKNTRKRASVNNFTLFSNPSFSILHFLSAIVLMTAETLVTAEAPKVRGRVKEDSIRVNRPCRARKPSRHSRHASDFHLGCN